MVTEEVLYKRLDAIRAELRPTGATLVGVSKTVPEPILQMAATLGLLDLAENRVQELERKRPALPDAVRWHHIGHLQRNKVKFIAPYVHLLHAVDSLELLQEIDRQAAKAGRVVTCLLQVYIAKENTKFGLSTPEVHALLDKLAAEPLANTQICGLMGMATQTDDTAQIRKEFATLRSFFDTLAGQALPAGVLIETLSMGMSSDWPIALQEGSTMVRLGSALFG